MTTPEPRPTKSSTRLRPNTLRLMVDNAVDAQYVFDQRRDTFLAVNPAMCELTGYSETELLNLAFSATETIHPDDRAAVERSRAGAEPGQTIVSRFRLIRKNGVVRWVEARNRLVASLGEQVVIGSVRDISDQVNLERQLRSRLDSEAERLRESEERSKEVVRKNARLYHLARVLEAFPRLASIAASLDTVDDVVKQTCLYITGKYRDPGHTPGDRGMGYDRCAIWLLSGPDLELAYANPFRVTARISRLAAPAAFLSVLSGGAEIVHTGDGSRICPVHAQNEVIGVLEVGVSRETELLTTDDPSRAMHDSVIQSLARFLGIHLANLRLLARVQQQVIEDPLTGLYNRRHFLQRLETEFRRASRYNRALSLLILDIDNFKGVNDTHSHPQGDLVLRAIGGLLSRSFRDLDSVCRIGGEEIAVIMPETRLQDAAAKAEAIRTMVEELRIPLSASTVPHQPGDTLGVTVSIGVASMGRGTADWEGVYQDADRALYDAKRAGRNRVAVAPESTRGEPASPVQA